MPSDIPEHICKRISKGGDRPICRGKCEHCPCAVIVRGVCQQLEIIPDISRGFTVLPEKLVALLNERAAAIWEIFQAGGELQESAGTDDVCGHTKIQFCRPLPPEFENVNPDEL